MFFSNISELETASEGVKKQYIITNISGICESESIEQQLKWTGLMNDPQEALTNVLVIQVAIPFLLPTSHADIHLQVR